MAVNDPGVVDIISIDPLGNVVLTISDHLDWAHTIPHQLILQEKLNRYLAFVESGEILESYPKAEGRPVILRVVTLFEPDASGIAFFERATKGVEKAGFAFRYGPSESGTHT